MTINGIQYLEKCDLCREPARTDLMTSDIIGVEWYQLCVNPHCLHWDGVNLKRKRDQLERRVRESKGYRRKRDRLWEVAIAERKGVTGQSDKVVGPLGAV
jgi:hypothetical protein